MLKSLKLTLLTILALFIIMPAAAGAYDVTGTACKGVTNSAACQDAAGGASSNPLWGPEGVLTKAISILSLVIGVIAVIIVTVAGIRLSLSQGDPQKITSARNTIIYAAVGLAVAAVAQALVQIVLTRLPS